jgi:homoserine kinase
MTNKVTVESPASSANLGAGFDVFALALTRPTDRLTLEKRGTKIGLSVQGGGVPSAADDNVVSAVARAIIRGEGLQEGVFLTLRKGVPVGAGLGSSAASSAAAAVGMNSLFGLRLPPTKLVQYAGIGEKLASGTAHYDNVTASIAGGFVIVTKDQNFTRIDPPASLALCFVVPQIRLPKHKTRFARSLLPDLLPIQEAVEATGSASLMVHGMTTGSVEEIGRAMMGGFVDKRRSVMIAGYDQVREAATAKGAAGICISGAGPAMLAVTTVGRAKVVLKSMVDAFKEAGVRSSGFVTRPGRGSGIIAKE